MVHKVVTTMFACDVCNREYDTEGEAKQCEKVPLTKCNFISKGLDGKVVQFNDWELDRTYMVKTINCMQATDEYEMMKVAEIVKYDEGHTLYPVFEKEDGTKQWYEPFNTLVRKVSSFDY